MAKGWLGRSRAPSNEPTGELIGQPTLTYTDAEARFDLHSLGHVTPTRPLGPVPAAARKRSESIRPRTAGEDGPSIFRGALRPDLPSAQSFDTGFQASRPSHREIMSPPADSFIGMALGSPAHPPPHSGTFNVGQSPLVHQDPVHTAYEDNEDQTTKSKGGKWRKFGGLLRAKSAFAGHGGTSPFYSLQSQYAAHISPPPNDTKPLPYQPSPIQIAPSYGIPEKAQRIMGGANSQSRRVTPPVNERSRYKPSMESSRSRSLSRGQSERVSHKQSNSKDSTGLANDQIVTFENSSLFLSGLPSLDVDIPDAQMERYSIMFGNVLGGKPNASNLLARRSRMLEKLKSIADEADKVETEPMPDIPAHAKEEAHLAPQAQPRRATSPTPAKSPGFSLFPQTPAHAEKSVGPMPHGKTSPLQRSFTAPPRMSPHRAEFDLDIRAPISETEAEMVSSPAQTTASTRGPKWSSDGSNLSPASATTSVHDDEILFDVKALSYLNENNELQWEMVSSEHLPESGPVMKKHRRPDHKPSPLAEAQSHGEEQSTLRDANDEALAALEAPAPVGQDVAPLRPSKAAVDRLMSPLLESSFSCPSKMPDPVRKEVTIPRLKVRVRDQSNPRHPAHAPAVIAPKPSIEHLMTAVTNDLDDLEQQIESRAVKAMRKQTQQNQFAEGFSRTNISIERPAHKPSPVKPMRMTTEENMQTTESRTESRAVRAAKKQALALAKAMPLDSMVVAAQAQAQVAPPALPANKPTTTPADFARSMTPTLPTTPTNDVNPSFRITSPAEVQVARSISVSKRQRQMLVPIGGAKVKSDENLVERTAPSPLTPQIVDVVASMAHGKSRGHRYERSQNVIVEST